MDGRFNHAHLRHTRHLDYLDNWENHKLPDDEIAVPLKHQPPLTEDNDDFNNLLPEQLKSENKKWTDLALDFLNDEPQQLQNQNPQQSQQIQ